MKYTAFRYLFPPRPGAKGKLPKGGLAKHEKLGWWAQFKKNGTCNVIFVSPEKEVTFRSRHPEIHGGEHRMWAPTEDSLRLFKRLPGDGWYVLVAELLHSKVTDGPKNTNYINEILVHNGDYLVGTTFEKRQELLSKLLLPLCRKKTPDELTSHIVLDDNTWLAKNHRRDFTKLFSDLETAWKMGEKAEDEGLVLKDPKARLDLCGRAGSNEGWQKKCRREHKNYGF